jgi:predicted nuclease of predicted toxin-antitoxin system
VRFLIDANLPPALAYFLKKAGHQAEHVEEIGLRHAKDTSIWNYALEHSAVVITKDEDFEERLSHSPETAPSVVWVRLGNTTKGALLLWFNNVLSEVIRRLEAGEKLIEII